MVENGKVLLRASAAVIGVLSAIGVQAQTTSGAEKAGASSAVANPGLPTSTADASSGILVPADEQSSPDDLITVTGSRIRRPNFTSFEPTVTLDSKYLEERNLTNVADALNELPGFRRSTTPNGSQGSFGQGVNFLNNLGLGTNRTLTLINGRRSVSSNVPTPMNQGSAGTQVDLNTIPAILVERVDTMSVGGAPVYGSDAISGTVNVILKTNFQGFVVSGLAGVSEQGDGFRYNASAAGGFNFDEGRGNISGSLVHDKQEGLLFNSRGFLRDNYDAVDNPSTAQAATLGRPAGTTFANDGRLNPLIGFNDSSSDGFPGTVVARNVTLAVLTRGGLITAGNTAVTRNFQFDPSGNLVPFNRGIPFLGNNSSGGDGFRFNDFSQITSTVERTTANVFLNYEFSDAVKFFSEGTYFHSRGDELVQQPSFNSSLFGGLSSQLTFDTTSPFLTDQARALLVANGVTTFQVSRASLDLADLTGFSTTNLYRSVAGFKGNFQIGERKFNYEVSGNYGRSNITDTRQNINAQNFINAVNVTRNTAGQIVCTVTPARLVQAAFRPIADQNCVPLDLLGEGRATQAARDYVIAVNKTESVLEQIVFNANAGGSFFDVFTNPVGFNIGYEHRQERGSFAPSDFEQRGLGRLAAIAPVSGRYNVDEVFGEVVVPLVTPNNQLSFLNRLEFFGRGRYVDNTVNGGFFAWAAGGAVAPIRDIEFRGNYTKSFRAPAITELFLPVSNSFAGIADVCSPGNRNAGAAPAIRLANCTAFLAAFPNATPLDAASAQVPAQSGGNPGLANEVARSFTYGTIVRPRFIRGLTFSADYISIKIANPIASLTPAQIVGACFDSADFNAADPANGNAFCSRIRRYARGEGGTAINGGDRGGQVISDAANPGIRSGFVNGVRTNFSGIQGAMDYATSLAGLGIPGSFEIGGDMLYVRRRLVDITGVAPLRSDGVGGDPEFSGQVNLRYVGTSFGMNGSFNYVGEQLFSRAARTRDIREFDKLDDFVTINAGIYVDATRAFRMSFAVTNLLNRQGQRFNGVLIPASYTDLIGRRFSVNARARF